MSGHRRTMRLGPSECAIPRCYPPFRRPRMPEIARPPLARRIVVVTSALLLVVAAVASAHDMFVKPAHFFVTENAEVLVRVLNGTFSKSENSIARPRVRDISVV